MKTTWDLGEILYSFVWNEYSVSVLDAVVEKPVREKKWNFVKT